MIWWCTRTKNFAKTINTMTKKKLNKSEKNLFEICQQLDAQPGNVQDIEEDTKLSSESDIKESITDLRDPLSTTHYNYRIWENIIELKYSVAELSSLLIISTEMTCNQTISSIDTWDGVRLDTGAQITLIWHKQAVASFNFI